MHTHTKLVNFGLLVVVCCGHNDNTILNLIMIETQKKNDKTYCFSYENGWFDLQRERDRERERVCVCVRERERERARERESERDRERVREKDREREECTNIK